MTDSGESGIIATARDKHGFVKAYCPICCKKVIVRLRPETVLYGAGLFCSRCGEINITIEREP